MPVLRKLTFKHLVVASASIAVTCRAASFLQPAPTNLQDVSRSLTLELADAVDHQRLAELRDALRPTFTALPKDENGHLAHQTVRYVLHRLFVQQHGWFIKGLEPDGDVWHSKTEVAGLKDWVPSYLLGQLEESVGSGGVDLDKLAALAAALEDLINREAVDRLTAVYEALDLTTSEEVSVAEAHKAFLTYLAVYLSGGKFKGASSAFETTLKTQSFAQRYTGWADVESWLAGIERDLLETGDAVASVPFSLASRVAAEVGKRFGTFNDMECEDLKFTLLGMHGHTSKAGRIRLPDFYKKSLHSHWRFTEKADYLRALGALDGSNASDPMVIIPNYVGARPNCLESAELYAVCCRNECEDLMAHLEQDIVAPTAEPERIVKLVEALGSPTVTTPRHLSEPLVGRLHEVASLHGGEVNIHGRLFAQWMHHAYPNECPYPHEAGSASPVTPDEWIGEDASASEEERHHVVASDPCPPGGCDHHHVEPGLQPALPWSHKEELLAGAPRRARKVLSWGRLLLALLLAVLAAATAFFGNSRFAGLVALELRFGLTWQVIALSLLACAAAAVELVHRTILACALVGGVLANVVSTVPASGSRAPVPCVLKGMKTAKCLV